MRLFIILIISISIISCKPKEEPAMSETKTIGSIEKLDPRLDAIISTDAKIEVLGEGYSWSEGPVWVESDQILIWSDVPENIAYSWKPGEQVKEYLNPSGYTGEGKREGSNGLLLNAAGELVLCQHGDRRVAIMEAPISAPKTQYKTIVEKYDGKKFNSPNDAAYGKDGSLYFTDPPYGLPGQDESPEKEISFNGVYRASADGEVTLMDKELSRPNGIAFNPDFTKCYVANSDPNMAIWKVYDVDENGNFQNGKVFFDVTSMVGDEHKGLPDGLRVNKNGTIFATGPGGVLIFSPQAEHLGTIRPGVAVANCTLNADQSIIFLTAHNYVTQVALK